MTQTAGAGNPAIIGHLWAIELLQRGIATGRLSHAYLFTGPARIGKTSLALYLAQALNCLAAEGRPCGSCGACVRISRGLHPDVCVIDGTSSIKIDQIRQMQVEMALSPFEGRRRVYVLCNFQQATLEASNCLLKTLEEPPSRTTLILTSTEAEALPATIVSRCQVLRLRPLAVAEVEQALQIHWQVEPQQAATLARISQGRIGWAIEASSSDAVMHDRDKYLTALEHILREDRTGRMGLAQQLCRNPQGLPDILDLWQSWWRDVLLVKSGNTESVTNVDRQPTLLAEAGDCTLGQVRRCLRAIQEAIEHVEQNVNPCLAMEVLLLRMPRMPVTVY
jgi:DNA polymerase-3 subunit delta'